VSVTITIMFDEQEFLVLTHKRNWG